MADASRQAKDHDPPQLLLKTLTRLFYDAKSIVAIDLFMQHLVMTDEMLAERMLITVKEAARLIARLKEDFLLQTEPWAEIRPDRPDAKPFVRTFAYIDYPLAIDSVKLRLHALQGALDQRMKEQHAGARLACPSCGRTFGSLDAQFNPMTSTFTCPHCPGDVDLQESMPDDNAEGPDDANVLYKSFMTATKPLLDLLKAIDGMKIAAFEPKKWIAGYYRKKTAELEGEAEAVEEDTERQKQEGGIDVKIMTEDAAVAKAMQMPAWYTHSTLTGEQYIKHETGDGEQKKSEKDIADEADLRSYYEGVRGSPAAVEPRPAEEVVSESAAEDVYVSVAGKQVLLSRITQEDQDRMTPDEYSAYYDALVEREGQQ